MELLTSIAKDTITESGLKLGKLKLNLIDFEEKNIEKTIMFVKRNLEDKDLTKENIKKIAIDFLEYDEDLLGDISIMADKSLGLGKIAYDNFLEIPYNNDDMPNTIYFDMNGKLAKSKTGSKYIWRDKKRGRFTAYDGKRVVAMYKIYNEISKRGADGDYFKSAFLNGFQTWYWSSSELSKTLEVILDIFQDDVSIKSMEDYEKNQSGEYAKAFQTKKNINKAMLEKMETTSFLENGFNYVEIDNSTDLEKFEQVEGEWNEVYSELPKVSKTKIDLRFRKLGKHRASGIYFPTQNCISIDPKGVSSMIHEYGHLVDYEMFDKVLSLTPDFRDIIRSYSLEVDKLPKESFVTKKRSYYTTPTEVFARAFEIYMSKRISTSFLKNDGEYETRDDYTCFNSKALEMVESFFDKLELV